MTDVTANFYKAEVVEANSHQATVRVAEACVETGTRLIPLSSTSVYGTQSEVVTEGCTEKDLSPQSPYAATKLKEEQLVLGLSADRGLKMVSCRFGTIYGTSSGMRFHTVVNKFCWQAVMGLSITVWSTAYDQKRPYLDIFDAARAISFIICEDLFDGRTYNVLTQNATVREVVNTIREFVPGLQIEFVDDKIMNQFSYDVSNERIRLKGFAFSGQMWRGIGETVSLLRQANLGWS